MESLGGNLRWSDRFFAGHLSLVYYWVLVVAFLLSPASSYCFSELLEAHAVDTYNEFLVANAATLASLPPPEPALTYYAGCGFYFREFHTAADPDDWDRRLTAEPPGGGAPPPRGAPPPPTLIGTNEPVGVPLHTLYDVFLNIRDDEVEHVRTMVACQAYTLPGGGADDVVPVRVTEERRRRAAAAAAAAGGAAAGDAPPRVAGDDADVHARAGVPTRPQRQAQAELAARRRYWKAWARDINAADHASRA